MRARIPEEMTMRQKEGPREVCEVASLLRLPRMETPRMSIRVPRVTKPEVGERRGQLVAM